MNGAPESPQHRGTGDLLPPVLAGPIVRRATADGLALWLVTSVAATLRLRLTAAGSSMERDLDGEEVRRIPFGERAFLCLVQVAFDEPVPEGSLVGYDLGLASADGAGDALAWIRDWAPHLCRPGVSHPDYVVKQRLDRVFHGSCRRPHHPAGDGLVRVDAEVAAAGDDVEARPALLLLTGDQVYVDDVAGPTLSAIHQLIERLGLFEERVPDAEVADSRVLRADSRTFYHRHQLLPATERNVALVERFFGGARKPVFSSANARNHLISLAEVMAMYLLAWSPVCWRLVDLALPSLAAQEADDYRRERQCIERFIDELPRAARALAHIPTYMIFDDHDVTDDWNLSALWETTVYEHAFSRRIVGNALIGYLLCQGWGNEPAAFGELLPQVADLVREVDADGFLPERTHDELVDALLRFGRWHYRLPTSPPVVVLDTRTHRWRSEIAPGRPSGLMDWEALTEFQQSVMGESAVIVVSPAPMFGVKLIEVLQQLFTFIGRPLVVDAENWMAHRGAASVLLNIFGHSGTPETFVVLSGDVHYSFAYDVRLRHRSASPRIWQVTSSGIKNEFPQRLLEFLDRLNRWLYAPRSPLNWFTKRRRMRISPRLPTGREAGERLWNQSGIGLVELDGRGAPSAIRQLNAGSGGTRFREKNDTDGEEGATTFRVSL
ncbi:alkaline phosphatase family protein [Microbulbifer litoralis]|uniref:alkaline phosphatase family protein n=1 Tax=Microbulbifer litoralis TaxID=2933965 RepID=UPI00202906D0|nr:alkaline phosphatase family protein [Microbulbifer sp. GX H0434]